MIEGGGGRGDRLPPYLTGPAFDAAPSLLLALHLLSVDTALALESACLRPRARRADGDLRRRAARAEPRSREQTRRSQFHWSRRRAGTLAMIRRQARVLIYGPPTEGV